MGNKNLSWFPMYANDWLMDSRARSLPPMFKSFYFDLLCFQWREGSIPNDSELCRRMLGTDWHLWYNVTVVGPDGEINYGDAWDVVSAFFQKEDSVRVNYKLRDIAVEQQQLNARYRDRAKRGGLAKARNRVDKRVTTLSTTKEVLLSRETESKAKTDPNPTSKQSPVSRSKPVDRSMSKHVRKLWWDEERKGIWGLDGPRSRLRDEWVAAGMTKDEFQRQMRKLNRWLQARPGKRGLRSNFRSRINNWMNNFVDEKERREDET